MITKIKKMLSERIDAALKEEVIKFIFENELNEESHSEDGKYTFTKRKANSNDEDEHEIKVCAEPEKLDNLEIHHPHKTDGQYSWRSIITVKNNHTGHKSHHSVYQSGYDSETKKPIMSVRSFGVPQTHSNAHAEALVKHLGKKL